MRVCHRRGRPVSDLDTYQLTTDGFEGYDYVRLAILFWINSKLP